MFVNAEVKILKLKVPFRLGSTWCLLFHPRVCVGPFVNRVFNSIQFNSILYFTLYKIFTQVYVGRKIK